MTKVIELAPRREYHERMEDFGTWLHDLAEKPLPGAVSAAAIASAIGTALLAKAVRISLKKKALGEEDRTALQAVLDLACDQQTVLLDLENADERAYRAVLESPTHSHETPAKDPGWREAIDVPIRVAEVCHLLLRRLPGIEGLCWPPVGPDLQVGQWLLEVGLRAGLSAAESNMQAWSPDGELVPLRARLDALRWDPAPE